MPFPERRADLPPEVGVEGGQALPFHCNPNAARFVPMPANRVQDSVRWQRLPCSPRQPMTALLSCPPDHRDLARVNSESPIRMRLIEPHQSLSTKVVLHAFLVPLRAAHHTSACVGIMSSSICCRAAACRLICSRRWITFSMRRSNSRAPRHSRSSVGRSVGKGIGPGLGPICRRLSPDARKPLVYHLRRTGPGDTQPNSTGRVAKTIQTSDLHGSARMPRSALESSAPAVTEELNRTPRRLLEATAQEVSLTISLATLAALCK
jgi:hypothetical protein